MQPDPVTFLQRYGAEAATQAADGPHARNPAGSQGISMPPFTGMVQPVT